MKKLKQALSLTLALALSLAMTVPALAAPVTYQVDEAIITFDDVKSQEAARVRKASSDYEQDTTVFSVDRNINITIDISAVDPIAQMSFKTVFYPAQRAADGTFTYPDMAEEDLNAWGGYNLNSKPGSIPWEKIPDTDHVYIKLTYANYSSMYFYYGGFILDLSDSKTEQPSDPSVTVEDIPASGTAYASTQTVTVDGKPVEFQMYALKDANGNGTNYIKLRDLAYVLNGTGAQFAVGYDGTIRLTTGQSYAAAGGEMTTPFSGDRTYSGGAQTLKIDGKDVALTAVTLLDDAGGGYNYFKLRDLGAALGFQVDWSASRGIYIETK